MSGGATSPLLLEQQKLYFENNIKIKNSDVTALMVKNVLRKQLFSNYSIGQTVTGFMSMLLQEMKISESIKNKLQNTDFWHRFNQTVDMIINGQMLVSNVENAPAQDAFNSIVNAVNELKQQVNTLSSIKNPTVQDKLYKSSFFDYIVVDKNNKTQVAVADTIETILKDKKLAPTEGQKNEYVNSFIDLLNQNIIKYKLSSKQISKSRKQDSFAQNLRNIITNLWFEYTYKGYVDIFEQIVLDTQQELGLGEWASKR